MIIGFALLFNLVKSRMISPKDVLLAINCGGNSQEYSHYGVIFTEDLYFSVSKMKDYSLETQQRVKYTDDVNIFMSQRYDSNEFTYVLSFDFDQPDYVLILLFAELQFTDHGKRVFNISVGPKTVVQDLDIYSKVGAFVAHKEYIPLDESMFLYQKDNPLRRSILIKFTPALGSEATVSGLMMVKGNLSNTDFDDQVEYVRTFDELYLKQSIKHQKMLEKQKRQATQHKQSIIKVRSGYEHEIFPQTPTPQNQQQRLNPFSFEVFKALLLSPFGILGCLALSFMTFLLVSFAFFDPYGRKNAYTQLNKQQ